MTARAQGSGQHWTQATNGHILPAMTAALAPPKFQDQSQDRLTDMQRAWVEAFVGSDKHTGDHIRSAKAAGYAESNLRHEAKRLLQLPHLREAVRARIKWELEGPLAALSIKRLRELLKKAKRSNGDRTLMATAFGILDRAGYVAPKASADTESLDLNTMSAGELQAILRDAEQRLADIATDVTPDVAGGTMQAETGGEG